MSDQEPFDQWSPLHLIFGIVLGLMGILDLWTAVIVVLVFEIFENSVLVNWVGKEVYNRERPVNMAVDVILGLIGYYVGSGVL